MSEPDADARIDPPERRGAGDGARRGDRGLLLGLLAALAIAASLTPIRNYDYWWHLAAGRRILEQRAVPRVDPFSFTAAGTPWVDHEWLFQVLVFLGHRALGPGALVLLKVVAVLLLVLRIAAHLERERSGAAAGSLILVVALLGASFRLDVRPELCTLLLVPLILDRVLRARARGSIRPLIPVPLLVALGANLHVGVIIVPPLLATGALATFVCERRLRTPAGGSENVAGPPPFAPRLLGTALLAALAAGLNPYGLRIYSVPFRLADLLASLPSPNLEWARPGLDDFPVFYLALAALLALAIVGRRGLDPVATPAALLVGALAAAHLRNIGIFSLVLPYGAARPARAAADALRPWLGRHRVAGAGRVRPGFVAAAVLLLAGIPGLASLPPRVVWGLGVASDNEPARAAEFLETERVGERLFNDVRFGGYLIWRRYPARRVFIDGRNEVYTGLLREIFAALDDRPAWERLLERYRIDAALLRYPPSLEKVLVPGAPGRPPSVVERAFSALRFPEESWALVYWDDDALVFVRRAAEYKDVIGRLEYRAIRPDDWRFVYAGVLARHRPVGPVLQEIRRKLSEDPACERARTLLRTFSDLAEALGPEAAGEAARGR